MRGSDLHYFPLAWPFLVGLIVALGLVILLVEIRILSYAYEKIGLSRGWALMILVLSFLGSAINIPVAELPPETIEAPGLVEINGVRYIIPAVQDSRRTIIAVNVGGAVIPALVSIYLLLRYRLFVRGLIGVVVVAIVVHLLARPVHGVGIAVPMLIPPIVSAAIALLLGRDHAPPVAYIAGCLGTLIGADLTNLDRVQGLGAPIASIGGAGTFDGVFLSGIIAVLITPLSRPVRTPMRRNVDRPYELEGFGPQSRRL
jgi:uncharacterized membrane protein